MTSTNPLVQAALQDYVDRIDRGEEIDVAAFVVQHADVADELRSFIALDLEARRLAGGAAPVVGSPLSKAPAVKPPPTNAEVSTHSIVGSIEGTAGGKPKSADRQTASAAVEKSTGDLPDVFGRYRVQKKLGSGAMGAVYLAEDTLLHRKVALKTPTFEGDKDGELLRRFYREARAVANLKHPNLCAVYDVGEIDGHHYISMEFVRGKKLQDYINPDKPMSEKQGMAVVRKIALAMHESHTQGVIHRDLKPDNIMVNEKGEPVVMDFGLVYKTESTNSTRITQRGMLVGSPAYMSKEQVEGDPDKLTAATDQYSLGVILYQLLTSKLPFEGGIHAVLASILTKEPSPPCQLRTDLNPHLEAVCLKMMAKEAKDRYPSMKAVAEAIAEVAKATSKAATSVVVPAQVDGSMTDGLTATFAGFSVATEQKLPFLSVTNSFVKARVRRPIQKRSNSLLYTVVAAAALLLLLSVIVWIRSGNALLKISVHVDDVEVTFQHETLTLVDGTHEYKVVPGEHVLHIKSKDAEFDTDKFTLKRGENPVVTVEVIESEIVTRLGNEVISRISQQPSAPADSLVFQDKRFKLFAEQLTWHEAQRKCRAMGGRMAEVRSSIENDFLMKLALNAKQTGIWLGSTDEVQQGTWLWSDDSGLAFNYFANGQPDRTTIGQHYLLMMIMSQRGQWCSQPDWSMKWTPGFICEWEIDDRDKAPLPPLEAADSSDATPESVSNLDRVAVGIWRPLIEATTVLTDQQHMKFHDGILELDAVPVKFQNIVARVVVRAEVRKISGENVTFGLRNAIDTEQKTSAYGAFFAGTEYLGGDFFGIGEKQGDTPWVAAIYGPSETGNPQTSSELLPTNTSSLDDPQPDDVPETTIQADATLHPGEPAQVINLDADRMTFGRAMDRDVVLSGPLVSARHAVLARAGDGDYLSDAQSVHGTYVNGKPMIRAKLVSGDRLQIGPILFQYEGNRLVRSTCTSAISVSAGSLSKHAGQTTLLDSLTFTLQPGEFVGLIGPSGAGKTTLLDALNGLRPATSGDVLLNNESLYEEYGCLKQNIGYVPQDDIIHRELTVNQALTYAARLRLPTAMNVEELNHIIGGTLEALDLTHRRDVVIGMLSGGQRKRVSVGVELLSRPGVLFLDEPTSGLDPGTESKLMKLFRRLADQGRTVVCTGELLCCRSYSR